MLDINCDMAEGIGNDEAIMPYISSCNVACGLHGGGDIDEISKTIRIAKKHKVRIGAHPSYPDPKGFGRRKMEIAPKELKLILKHQISVIEGLALINKIELVYVKPHGALYHEVANNMKEAQILIEVIQEAESDLALMGKAGSMLESYAKGKVEFIPEAFIDRSYEPDGNLRPRSKPNAVIHDPAQASQQLFKMFEERKVDDIDGNLLAINAASFCIHGDNENAIEILKYIHEEMKTKSISLKKFNNAI